MRFILLINGSDASWRNDPPEVQERVIAGHQALTADLQAAGKYLGGGGLDDWRNARYVHRDADDNVTVLDGPFVESKEHTGGYYEVDAESYDEAVEWAKRIPGSVAATIEVRAVYRG